LTIDPIELSFRWREPDYVIAHAIYFYNKPAQK